MDASTLTCILGTSSILAKTGMTERDGSELVSLVSFVFFVLFYFGELKFVSALCLSASSHT
jgi:hypothetical protein